MTDPIILAAHSISGLSAEQMQALFRTPFVGHVNKVPRLGAAAPVNIFNGVGLWYWGTTPFGDWSGTLQEIDDDATPGSGGPAACPYPTGGANTILHAGVFAEVTGHDGTTSTRFHMEVAGDNNLSTVSPFKDWDYKLAVRKKTAAVIGWNANASTGSKVAADVVGDPAIPCLWDAKLGTLTALSGEDWDAYTFTGDDWCIVTAVGGRGNDDAPADESGTATGGTTSTLVDSGGGWSTNQWATYEIKITGGTGAGQRRQIASNNATTITVGMLWGTAPDATSTYEIREVVTVGRPGWYRIDDASSSTLTLTDDAIGMIHESDGAVSVLIVQSAQAKYVTGLDYIDVVEISATSGRTSSRVSDGDTLEVGSVTYTFKNTPAVATDIAIPAPSHASGGWTTTQRNTMIDNIVAKLRTHPEVDVVEADADITDRFNIRAKTRAEYVVNLSLATYSGVAVSGSAVSFGKLYSAAGDFATLASDDDTVEIKVGGLDSGSYAGIESGTANILWIRDTDLEAFSDTTGIEVVQFLRWPFVERDVVLDATTGAFDSATVNSTRSETLTLTAQPAVGDTLGILGGTATNADRISKTYTFVASGATGDQINIGATTTDTATNIASVIDTAHGGAGPNNFLNAVASTNTVVFSFGSNTFATTSYTITKTSKSISFGMATSAGRIAYSSALSGNGWTDPIIKRGDLYLVWAVPGSVTEFDQHMTTNPEAVPTLSAASSQACWWPYGTAGRMTRTSYKGNYANVFASHPNSQLCTAWSGICTVPRELFLHGDKLEITMLLDVQSKGTPYLIEVLLIPNFDPELDWIRNGNVANGERLLYANGKAMWFQSPIILEAESNCGLNIKLSGQAGSVQTVGLQEQGDNYSQQWDCSFEVYGNDVEQTVSGTGGGANAQARGFPAVVGPAAHITYPTQEDFAKLAHSWTILVATIHPSQKNKPGYHGYYGGEPYSTLNGNGGSLFTYRGQTARTVATTNNQSYPPLPYGGTFRVAGLNVIHTPGGSY